MSITNEQPQDLSLGHALHSYFAVSNPQNTRIATLDKTAFDDKITGKTKQVDTLLDCVGPIDRIYFDNSVQVIVDSGWQREIHVSCQNSQHWVLWNPGQAIASNMPDVHDGGENEYVCLEAADTLPLILSPGDTKSISQRISVKALNR